MFTPLTFLCIICHKVNVKWLVSLSQLFNIQFKKALACLQILVIDLNGNCEGAYRLSHMLEASGVVANGPLVETRNKIE